MPDTYPSVMSALTRRYTLLALLSGRCTLALAGEGPRISDPHAILEEEADLARAMKACTPIEAGAIELEVTRPDLPVSRSKPKPGEYQPRRVRASTSKCELLAAATGEKMYHEKFVDLVCLGFEKTRAGLLAAGLLDDRPLDPFARGDAGVLITTFYDYRGARTEGRRIGA